MLAMLWAEHLQKAVVVWVTVSTGQDMKEQQWDGCSIPATSNGLPRLEGPRKYNWVELFNLILFTWIFPLGKTLSFSGCGWGIDDLISQRHCHLYTLSLNMGRYLMKLKEVCTLQTGPHKERAAGRKEREKGKKLKRTENNGGTFS